MCRDNESEGTCLGTYQWTLCKHSLSLLILASLLKEQVGVIFFFLLNPFLLHFCWKQKWTVLVTCHLNKRGFITFNQLLWQECCTCQWWLSSQVPVWLFWPPENSFSVYAAYMSGVWPSGARPIENHRLTRCCPEMFAESRASWLRGPLLFSSSLSYGFFRTECCVQSKSSSSVSHRLV